ALDSVTIDLHADGEEIESAVLSEAGDWKHIFTDLPKENDAGDEIEYTVVEEYLENYESEVTGDATNGYTVTNTEKEEPVDIDRLYGDLRYDTAIEISQEHWEDGALKGEAVILARGDDFADALAGVPLASAIDSPILLVPSGSSEVEKAIVEEVYQEVDRLGASEVYILGEEEAVPVQVEKQFNNTMRLAGDTRTETAVAIADWLVDHGHADGENVVVANGYDFPDALAVASPAAQNNLPILLTQADTLSEATAEALEGLGANEVVVQESYTVGGEKVVSADVFDDL